MNKVILIGNVGRDPEVKTSQQGKSWATLTVATTERGYERQDGTRVEDQTEWHRVIVFGGTATFASKYIHKGDRIVVEGKIRTSQKQLPSGEKRYFTDIIADNVDLVTPRSQSQNRSTYEQPADYNQGNQQQQPGKDMYGYATQKVDAAANSDTELPF